MQLFSQNRAEEARSEYSAGHSDEMSVKLNGAVYNNGNRDEDKKIYYAHEHRAQQNRFFTAFCHHKRAQKYAEHNRNVNAERYRARA